MNDVSEAAILLWNSLLALEILPIFKHSKPIRIVTVFVVVMLQMQTLNDAIR